jgi:hypothetical protein
LSCAIHELPQALPFVHTLQHAAGVAPGVPSVGSESVPLLLDGGSEPIPRLAVAVANNRPTTDAQILNAALIVPPSSGASGDTARAASSILARAGGAEAEQCCALAELDGVALGVWGGPDEGGRVLGTRIVPL